MTEVRPALLPFCAGAAIRRVWMAAMPPADPLAVYTRSTQLEHIKGPLGAAWTVARGSAAAVHGDRLFLRRGGHWLHWRPVRCVVAEPMAFHVGVGDDRWVDRPRYCVALMLADVDRSSASQLTAGLGFSIVHATCLVLRV